MLNQQRTQIGNYSFYNFTDGFKAKDGWVMVSVIGNNIWKRFTELIGRKDMLTDERFSDDNRRYRNRHLISSVVSEWVAGRTVSEVVLLEEKRIPCGRVNTVADLIDHPHLTARQMLIKRNYPGIGEVPIPGIPIKLSKTPGKVETNAADLGEHNTEIFSQLLKYSQKELDSLKLQGVI